MDFRALVCALALCLLTAVPPAAEARPFRRFQIPNLPANCGTCHFNQNSGGARNDFGQDVERTLVGGDVDWSALFDLDSDGDGYTNGQELADPEGTWRIGDDSPSGNISEPGNDMSSLCDNGTLESDFGETCDLNDFGGESCESLGLAPGDLSCDACQIQSDGCGAGDMDMGVPMDASSSGADDAGSDVVDAGPSTTEDLGAPDLGAPGPGSGSGGASDGDASGDDGCQAVAGGSALWLLLPFSWWVRRRRSHEG